jgi:4'-phosphopantetheinyl transferase
VIAELYANARAPWPLRAGVVHVWRFPCTQDPGELAAALSDEERAAADRFVAPVHRDAYVTQHALVRALLGRYLGVAPAQVAFTHGPRGKPHVDGIEHNLAHTDDVALLAVAHDLAIGVDLERYDAAIDPRALARIVLAPAEAACTDRRAFMRVWCRKEACLKATGVGLIDDLTSVSVIDDAVDVRGTLVHVQDLAIGGAHAAALATSAPCAPMLPEVLERT